MPKLDWAQREEWFAYLRRVREDNPPPLPLREVAALAVAAIERDRAGGVAGLAVADWRSSQSQRLVESVYQELRQLEAHRDQIYTKPTGSTHERPVVIAATFGVRNPTTGAHERPVARTIGRAQFQQWHGRQLVLFGTHAEKVAWGDEVSAYWDRHQDLPTLEAVCAAAGIPFEPAFAAEMA